MDRLTKEQRHKNMLANKSQGTQIELLLARVLWNAGIRYRKNDKNVLGTPDFSIRGHRIAIFCDGEFWHGRNWEDRKENIKSNRSFWYPKIERNIRHDSEVTQQLEKEGWKVFRFWETDIRKQADWCVNQVLEYIQEQSAVKSHIHLSHLSFGDKTPFTREMAIVSHYLHNRTLRSALPFEKQAKEIIADLFDVDIESDGMSQLVAEPQIQYSLGSNLNSAPFPPQDRTHFTFVDLNAGIGSFRLVMQHLGGRCVFCSESNPTARYTYLINYGEIPFGRLTDEEISVLIPDDFDLLCAHISCQRFSLTSKKNDIERTRGTQFFQIASILRQRQPQSFILETDSGLLTHDKGQTLEILLRVLRDSLGYDVPYPQVLNAKDFGLPQDRKCAYLIGVKKELNMADFHFPIPGKVRTTFADIQENLPVAANYYLSQQVMQTLSQRKETAIKRHQKWTYEATPHGGILHVLQGEFIKHQRNFVIDHRQTELYTQFPYHGTPNREGIRKLTPREMARLQGFPDEFQLKLPDASLYPLLEKASPVNVIRAIARNLVGKFPHKQGKASY